MTSTNGTRPGVRFCRVELDYGRHSGAFDLDAGNKPLVIGGANGTGKSSLIEGLVRTLYGFRRGRRDERAAYERRRPWTGGSYRGRVTLETAQGAWDIERDFETDFVTIIAADESSPLFEGEANATRAGESARRFRTLLRDAVGLSDLDDYLRTACVFQGGLRGTSLSLDLVRVAAGGHTDVESAQARLRGEYRELTLEPIGPAASKRRKPGAVERLEREAADLEARTRAARTAEEKRGPLVRARDEQRRGLEGLATDLAALEAAFETLSEARRLEDAAEMSRGRVRRLERTSRDLDEALARLDLARERMALGPAPVYPEDFLERARALEEGLWPRAETLQTELGHLLRPSESTTKGLERYAAPAGLALSAAAALAWVFGSGTLAAAALALGLSSVALWVGRRRAEVSRAEERAERRKAVQRDLEEVKTKIAGMLDGVPDASTLLPGTLTGRRAEFARELADRRLIEESERSLRMAMDLSVRELNEVASREERESDNGTAGDSVSMLFSKEVPGGLAERARHLLRSLQTVAATERDETLAPLKLQLGEVGRVRFDLPAGAEPSVDGVRAARRRCLERTEAARAELASIERELAVETRPEASTLLLERELDAVHNELVDRQARARAYRRAFRLVADAYEAFRQTDEDRLLAAVSSHLNAVSHGALGPLEASGGLEDARILLGGRLLPIDSPPLSYGQLHVALLSIRLGAADFLAGLGVRLPLLIDDPFVHLDDRTAEELWDLLTSIARERQVIVATQDRLVLRHLGVEPDLTLEAPDSGAPRATPVRASSSPAEEGAESSNGGGAAGGEAESSRSRAREAPDLWSQLEP